MQQGYHKVIKLQLAEIHPRHQHLWCLVHLVVNSTRLKTVRSALWRCPNSTVALRLLENVVKVTNLEVVKIEFRHLPVLLSSSFFSQPSALTRAVLKTKHTQIAVKFFEDVPFELSF